MMKIIFSRLIVCMRLEKTFFLFFLNKHDIFVRLFFQMKDGQKFPHFDKYPNFTIITNFLFEVFIKIMVVCRQMKKKTLTRYKVKGLRKGKNKNLFCSETEIIGFSYDHFY